MKTATRKPVEAWAVIVWGTRIDMYAPPECYPEDTLLKSVMRQPFAGRIRRFCLKRGDGGWMVKVTHSARCDSVLCVCKPALNFERVG